MYIENIYLKTNDNILLDSNTYNIVGIVTNSGKVEIW